MHSNQLTNLEITTSYNSIQPTDRTHEKQVEFEIDLCNLTYRPEQPPLKTMAINAVTITNYRVCPASAIVVGLQRFVQYLSSS